MSPSMFFSLGRQSKCGRTVFDKEGLSISGCAPEGRGPKPPDPNAAEVPDSSRTGKGLQGRRLPRPQEDDAQVVGFFGGIDL
jgi:hypothetical protein